MAVQVSQVQPKRPKQQQTAVERNPLGDILTLGGAIIGGASTGTPQGAMLGAQAGQMAGGIVAQPTVSKVDVQAPSQGPQTVATGGDVLSRRLSEIGQGDQNMQQIASSIDSLKYVQDEDLRYKLAQPLIAADMAAMKQQGQV